MSIENYIKSCEQALIKTTCDILKIKSTEGKPEADMPFGKGPTEALEFALNLANEFGLITKNLNNYVGWAQWGEGEELVGILVHLDVVPEGSGWTYPPYGGQIHDGKIYGRGAVDDKGPAMAALFALKVLKDAGIKFNKRVRIIFGINEETGMDCLTYYLEHDEIPDMAFSPDANYPIINGEKGIMRLSLSADFGGNSQKGASLVYLRGGERHNMVPDYGEACITGDVGPLLKTIEGYIARNNSDIKIELTQKGLILKSYGIAAHGSTPEKGKNAVIELIALICELGDVFADQSDFLHFINKKIGFDTTGKGLGIDFEDSLSGKLSFNVGIADIDGQRGSITVDIRYPISYKGVQIIKCIEKEIPPNISIEDVADMEPHYVPEDNFMIQKLKAAYEKVTGQEAYCFTIGGGTYARMIENAVAFGPTFPGKPDLCHVKDEYIEVDDLLRNFKIYVYVIKELVSEVF